MVVRIPNQYTPSLRNSNGLSQLENEILAEKASALGHHGRKVEDAIKSLIDAGEPHDPELVDAAAADVWEYFVQRELCGMTDHKQVIADMGIPAAVVNRVGVLKSEPRVE